MVEIKEMPFQEMYKMVLNYHKGLSEEVLPIVRGRLGGPKVAEIKRIWH